MIYFMYNNKMIKLRDYQLKILFINLLTVLQRKTNEVPITATHVYTTVPIIDFATWHVDFIVFKIL